MANYDDFKRIARDALDTIADVSVEAYKLAEEKAKVLAKRAKLKAGITHERALIRRMKMEIGDAYYKLFKDAPAEEFKQSCEDITAAFDRIAAKQRELDELKSCEEACECEDAETESAETEDTATEDAAKDEKKPKK